MPNLSPSGSEVALRPIRVAEADETDLPFLRELYASTRREEMALSGWPQERIEEFLRQQFEAQHHHYMLNYPDADFDLIVDAEGEAIGRLYLEERMEEFRIIDIALLPAHRGKGMGGRLLRDIVDLAGRSGKVVRIHVEHNNPAMSLYRRLGFSKIDTNGIYHLMELAPKSQTVSS